MKKLLLLFVFGLMITPMTFAQVDAEYTETLKEMFKVSGTEESYKASIKQMINMFKQQYPNAEDDTWKELQKEFSKSSMTELVEMLVPVYKKHLSQEDLEGIIAFYKTEVGRKYAEKQPLLMEESMQVGQQWGMKIGQKMQERMQNGGE